MTVINSFVKFAILLIALLLIAFLIEIGAHHFMKIELFGGFIIGNYLFNFAITLFTYFIFLFLLMKNSKQLGFVFLGSSMLKFILFLVFIKPNLELEHGIRSLEFATFFVPYTVSTSLEAYYLIRHLRQ